ncbi:MAG: RES family NAD+ phosphorylase [Solirubrobacterales bacterium]
MRHVNRGGRYLRIAESGWRGPLSGKYSRESGGRWNAPGSFEVVYLNATVEVARAQVRRKLEPRGILPEDLDPAQGPDLIRTEIPTQPYVDACTEPGLVSLGLPPSYPTDKRGREIPHSTCQSIGQQARDAGEAGIACRSAASAPSPGEELAYFSRDRKLPTRGRESFSRWYWRAD